VKLRLAALAVPFALQSCTTPEMRVAEPGPAWACASRTSDKGMNLTVIRTLDWRGQQLDAEILWSVSGFDGGRLSLMGTRKIEGAGEPPVSPSELLVSWAGFPDRLQRSQLLVVLHLASEPPNVLDGVVMIPYVNGLIGAVFSWQRVAALAHNSPSAQLSLIDPRGHAIRSAPVDLSRLGPLFERTQAALEETRVEAQAFAKRCEPVSEWKTL